MQRRSTRPQRLVTRRAAAGPSDEGEGRPGSADASGSVGNKRNLDPDPDEEIKRRCMDSETEATSEVAPTSSSSMSYGSASSSRQNMVAPLVTMLHAQNFFTPL